MAVEQLCLLASRVASYVQKYNAKGYSRTVRLYPLASRAASQLQKDDAKGYSLTVKLYPLASREMSHAEYQSRIFGCRMRSVWRRVAVERLDYRA
jgi:hypothetical protein